MAEKQHEYEPLSDEELEAQHGEEIPEREATSVLGLPVVGPGGGIPIEPPEPPPSDVWARTASAVLLGPPSWRPRFGMPS